jgi:hypothetical protein
MAFRLKDVRTGTVRSFTTREILSLLGDSINDEILIGQHRYRISSCEETDSGGGGVPDYYQIDWQKFQLPVTQGNQTLFSLPHDIADAESVFLTINNVLYEHGENRDFHLQDRELYWHGGFPLDTNDRVVVRYPLLVVNQ